MLRKLLPFFTLLLLAVTVSAQEESFETRYNPKDLFSPSFYPTGETITRLADGSPNTGYWQNRADYQINATLDDVANTIKGTAVISYKNNSPHSLPFLWIQLDQNLYNKEGLPASPFRTDVPNP